MKKITLLGAGSGFTQTIFTDILNIEGLEGGVFGMVDVDRQRLNVNVRLVQRILEIMNKKKWRIEASTDSKQILKGTDYLISTIEVAGLESIRFEYEIPMKFGIDQCIGDTMGPGGVMKALRTLPTFLKILKEVEQYCPNALIMNYTNPMSMMTLGAIRTTSNPLVGLCHSVQGNSRQIARILGIPYEELEWKCAGINHMSWFTTLKWKGKDMHAALRMSVERPEIIEAIPIRSDLVREFGYFSTEGCGHFSEYVPYYRKRKDLLNKYCRPGHLGGSGHYIKSWPTARSAVDLRRKEMADGLRDIPLTRSREYAADIIEAHIFDRKKVVYASVSNTSLISNLSTQGVVEVATLVDSRGFSPTYFGNLPEQCAALCRANMAVVELAVQGILHKNRESIIHAMMLDPLSAAVCSPNEIRKMAEELFDAGKKMIPSWCSKKPKPIKLPPMPFFTPYIRSFELSSILAHKPLHEVSFETDISNIKWKQRHFVGSGNFCNLHSELDRVGKSLVFWKCCFKCSEDMILSASLGYDGPIKVWLDGKELLHDPAGKCPAQPDSRKINFNAKKGAHQMIIGLDSNSGLAWGIYLRFERCGVGKKRNSFYASQIAMPEVRGVSYDALDEVSDMAQQHAEQIS